MPIPEYIVGLRRQVGHALLWLPGVTAVILRARGEDAPEVLLTLRTDLGVWSPVSGIIEPGEEPQSTAVREAREEAGVDIEVESLVAIAATDEISYPNGDRCVYLDTTLRCRWVSGDPTVGDDESTDVRWWPVDALPEGMRQPDLDRIAVAVANPATAVLGREALRAFSDAHAPGPAHGDGPGGGRQGGSGRSTDGGVDGGGRLR